MTDPQNLVNEAARNVQRVRYNEHETREMFVALDALDIALAALDAAPDDGWRPDRPGWYWVKFTDIDKVLLNKPVPAQYFRYSDGEYCWYYGDRDMDDPYWIGPALMPPPGPSEEEE